MSLMKKHLWRQTLVVSALFLGVIPIAKATVTTTLTIGDDWTLAESGFAGNLPGGLMMENGGLYGVYQFAATAVGNVPSSFWSTCLSPAGNYANGSYTELTYAQANPGINPNAWAQSGSQLWGIQNAQYLWRAYSQQVIASGSRDEGAGLALAMYAALYNSTGYGTVTTMSGSTPFNVTTWVNNSQSAYSTFINGLTTAGSTKVQQNLADGYVLVPSEDVQGSGNSLSALGDGQEFILNFSPVPEPTTMVAGALLLLPFGLSTLRMLRKNHTA